MPLFWLPPASPIFLEPIQVQEKVSVSDYGDQLDVFGNIQEFDLQRQVAAYSEGVIAKFGPTVVKSDRLEVHRSETEQYAIARGNVILEDPEGTMRANYIIFWFGKQRGPDGQLAAADRVEIEIGGVKLKAESAVIKADRWEFLNVEGTNCQRPLPLYSLKSKKVVIYPGKEGTAYSPRVTILGKDFGKLPNRTFSLDRRNPGIQVPSVSYKSGAGLGVSWTAGLLVDQQSLVASDFSIFPRQYPSYGLTYARSFIPADLSSAKIIPRSELLERFNWSYFDDVRVETPESSTQFASRKRNSLSVQSLWNTGSSSRIDSEKFDKALDITYEKSGPVGPFGLYWQGRAQSIQKKGDDGFRQRGLIQATLQAPPQILAKGLSTDFRFDCFGKVGGDGPFGWVRAQAGLIFQPIPQLRFGAAYVSSGEAGSADFLSDRLVSRHATHLRADINLGPTKISYLAKYDFDRNQWYDREMSISQVIGCLEPYMVRREFPSDYALGVRLRLGDFMGILQRRKQVRTKPVGPQTISSLPKKP